MLSPNRTLTSLPARIPPKEILGSRFLICHGKFTPNDLPLIQQTFAENCIVPAWGPETTGPGSRNNGAECLGGDRDTPSKKTR